MLIIRYQRVGKRNHAQFKIVVAEKSSPIKGKSVEILGSYDPHNKEAVLKKDRINYWLGIGAQCSDSVHNLLVSKGLIKDKKIKINIKQKPAEEKEGESQNHSVQGEEKEEQPKSLDNETKKAEVAKEDEGKKEGEPQNHLVQGKETSDKNDELKEENIKEDREKKVESK